MQQSLFRNSALTINLQLYKAPQTDTLTGNYDVTKNHTQWQTDKDRQTRHNMPTIHFLPPCSYQRSGGYRFLVERRSGTRSAQGSGIYVPAWIVHKLEVMKFQPFGWPFLISRCIFSFFLNGRKVNGFVLLHCCRLLRDLQLRQSYSLPSLTIVGMTTHGLTIL